MIVLLAQVAQNQRLHATVKIVLHVVASDGVRISNAVTCDYVENDLDSGVQTLILGHLREQNNHPEIVRISAEQSLLRRGLAPRLVIAEQKKPTEVFAY